MKPLLLIALLVSSPVWAFGHKAPSPVPSPTPTLVIEPIPAHSVSVTVDPGPEVSPRPDRLIEIEQIQGATPDEVKIIDAGLQLANDMLKSPCFKQWVLAARYTENNGLTQAQIYARTQTTPMTVNVEMYSGTWSQNHVSKTVGYENDPYDGWVHMNRYFVNTPYMVADNLLHEDRGHGLGFHHYGTKATSAPYGFNFAYEGCSQQQMQTRGAKAFKPPGIRLEIRHAKKVKKKPARYGRDKKAA